MHRLFATALSFLTLSFSSYSQNSPSDVVGKRQFILILDTNDPGVFDILASKFKPDDIAFVGMTLLDSRHKAILARKQLDQIGFTTVPVIQGNGGEPSDYELLGAIMPPAPPVVLDEEFFNPSPGRLRMQHGEVTLMMEMAELFKQNYQAGNRHNIDVILLGSPEDLHYTLNDTLGPAIKSIGRVHMRGAWTNSINPVSKKHELRSSYSWNMSFDATRKFFQAASQNIFPFSIRLFLSETLTLLGAAVPSAIQVSRPIRIELNLDDLDFQTGFRVDLIKPRTKSSIEVVDQMDCSPHLANVVGL